MRRLPDEAAAASLLARGSLDADALARLAEVMSAFLEAAPVRSELGTLDVLGANVAENFAQVEPFVGDLVDAGTFAEVRAYPDRRAEQRAERVSRAGRRAPRCAKATATCGWSTSTFCRGRAAPRNRR